MFVLLLFAFLANPQQFDSRVQDGIAALEKNDLAKAQANFEDATRLTPTEPRAWLLLAQTYARQKNEKQALAAAQKAETLGADDPQILQGLANFYAATVRDLPKAASLGARYAEKSPGDPTAWRRLAAFCLETGQPERAVDAAKRGLARDNTAEMHGVLGQAYLQQKDFPHALEELSAALKLDPYNEDAHFRLAQAYLVQLDYDHAIAVLLEARKTFDKSPQIELALGVAYYGKRRFADATGQFFRTIQLNPDIPQPYVFLDRMMDHLGERIAELTTLVARFEAGNPKNPLGYLLHAKVLIAQMPPSGFPPEVETALALLKKSIELREDNWDAHYQMGVLLDRKKDYAAAAAHLERSIGLNAGESVVHFRLAHVYDRLGRQEDAAKQRELAEKLGEKAIQQRN